MKLSEIARLGLRLRVLKKKAHDRDETAVIWLSVFIKVDCGCVSSSLLSTGLKQFSYGSF